MQSIGKLNKYAIGEYKDIIQTDEVILTNERLYQHILIYHKQDYEQFNMYIKEIISNPDYVIEDNKHKDTLIFLKEIKTLGKRCRIVIKLATKDNKEHPKNSIITLMGQNNRTWNQTIKNKGKIISQNIDKDE